MLKVLVIAVSALAQPAIASADAPRPDQFAFHMTIALNGDASIYSMSLPLEAYQSVSRSDFGDLRVFNAAGETVPHQVQPAPPICGRDDDTGRLTLSPVERAASPLSYDYDAGAWLPVDTLSVELPQRNTIATIEVSSRRHSGNDWQLRFKGPVYAFDSIQLSKSSQPIRVDPRAHRYWRITPDDAGGGLGQGVPRLRLAWQAHELVFVARGPGPYTVAAGNASLAPSPRSVARLFDAVKADRDVGAVMGTARLVGPVRIIDKAYLKKPRLAAAWKRGVLWGMLTIGVLGLGWLAFNLYREMNLATRG